MLPIPRETVEQVLAATDIVDLIGSYVPLKRAGSRFVANCPFHDEKTPSFSIDPARQFYHCFGCNKSGDAVTFIRDFEGLTFVDSVRKLASKSGITIAEQALNPRQERARAERGRLLDLHREAARYFHQLLLESPAAQHARDYLKSRNLGREMVERWEVGWAPSATGDFISWAREKGMRGRDLVASGLALEREKGGIYLRFRDRLMFPVRNTYGDTIAFSGRQLKDDPRSGKYINSPETSLFKKSEVLFALDRSRKGILDAKSVLICEGQIDAICCHENGFPNAVANLGTAFTPQHASNLKRYTQAALLCFDADKAGFSGAKRAFRELAGVGIRVRVVQMPGGNDPDSFIQEKGAEAFRKLLDEAPEFFDFIIGEATANGQLATPSQRTDLTLECAGLLALVKESVTRDALMNHVATRLQTGVPELRDAVSRAARASQKRVFARPNETKSEQTAPEAAALDPCLGYLSSLAMHSPEVQEWLAEQIESIHELGEQLSGSKILLAILASRPDPLVPAAINGFLSGLPEAERLALCSHPSYFEAIPEAPLPAAEEALAAASALVLEKQDQQIKAALGEPNLPIEKQIALLGRAKEIAELLSGLPSRALNNDRFLPNSRRAAPSSFGFPRRRS